MALSRYGRRIPAMARISALAALLGCGTAAPRSEHPSVATTKPPINSTNMFEQSLLQDAHEAAVGSLLRANAQGARVLFMPPSKTCFVTGGERNMALLTVAMHKFGFETHSLIGEGTCAEILRDAGTTIHSGSTSLPLRYPPEALGRFQRALDAWQQDAESAEAFRLVDEARLSLQEALAHGEEGALVVRPADERAAQVMTSLLHIEETLLAVQPDTLVTDLPWDALAAILATRGTSTRVVSYVQSAERDLSDAVVGRFAAIVACSVPSAERFRGMPQVVVVKNGINPRRFAPGREDAGSLRALMAVGSDAFVVGQTGYIDWNKNQLAVVRAAVLAAEEIPNLHVAFFGVAPQPHYLRQLKDEIFDHGLSERIHFFGHREDLTTLLGQLDVFVFPSRQESFGLGLAEAMATGVPVLANRLPAYADFVCEGVELLDVQDSDVFARALIRVADEGPRRRIRGLAGRQQIMRRGLTTDRMLAEFATVLGAAPTTAWTAAP